MTLDEIYNLENISLRSINICRYYGLNDLSTILSYHRVHKTFYNLRNCGRKSNDELINLCKKYIDDKSLSKIEIKQERPNYNVTSDLNRTQREILNAFIEINFNGLSIRSKNALKIYLNNNLKIRNFSEKILTNNWFNLNNIKNVGSKSFIELNIFFETINKFIREIAGIRNEKELTVLKNKFIIQKTFSLSDIPLEILESQSIFKLIDFLIYQNALFEKKKNIIFQKALKIYDNQSGLALDNIAEELNLSRERIRQIRKICLDGLYGKLQFVNNIDDDLLQKYDIDRNQNFIFIDEKTSNRINNINITNFSQEFITYLISAFWSNEFVLVGDTEDVLLPKNFKSKNRHNWNSFYLIHKSIYNEFDFYAFADNVDLRLNSRIEETYSFNIKSYLANFLMNNNYELLTPIAELAEKIINNEFKLFIDLDDNIVFNRNTSKQAYEYAYEALLAIGKPSSVKEITKKINMLHPNYNTDDGKVRASLKRQNGFVPIGRKSIFGLLKWEKEFDNFKGGTIRRIALEYLDNQSEPKHISEITEYILQYRPKSNGYSILQNLKLDKTNVFVFFRKSFIGVSYKKYHSSFELLTDLHTIEKKSWEERYKELIYFINKNKRMPLSSGSHEKEQTLYRWYSIQLRKSKVGKLDEKKGNLIRDISGNLKLKSREEKLNRISKIIQR